MQIPFWILVISAGLEVALLFLALLFFVKFKKSENLLQTLQDRQQEFLQRLDFNTRLESELISTFTQRQEELAALEEKLQYRVTELRRLLEQAENFTKSPQFLRQTILSGFERGQSVHALAQATGLSLDEVELIIDQNKA